MILGYPAIPIKPGYFDNASGDWGSSLKLELGGFLTATATIPTFAFALYTTSVQPAAWAATNLMCTASTANTPSSATTFPFYMRFDLGLRTSGLGAGATIVTHGFIESPGFASPFKLWLPPAGTGNTFATYDTNLQYYLWPTILLSAATAGNTVTTQWCKLYGEN
jgi:hypothetical protein